MKLPAIFISILFFIGLPYISTSATSTIQDGRISTLTEKTNSRKIKRKNRVKKIRRKAYENKPAIFILGAVLSLASVILLIGSGTGGLSVIFGFFGGLLCFLAWTPDDDVHLPLIGVAMGALGFLGGLKKFFSTRD